MPRGVSTKSAVPCCYCGRNFLNRANRFKHEKCCVKTDGDDVQAEYDTGLSLNQLALKYGVTSKFIEGAVRNTRSRKVGTRIHFENTDRRPYSRGQSHGEKAFEEKLKEAELGAVKEMPLAGYRLDFAFPAIKLDVEIDGCQHYRTEQAKQHDGQRDAKLMALGWTVYRIDSQDFLKRKSVVFSLFMEFLRLVRPIPSKVAYLGQPVNGNEKFRNERTEMILNSGIDLKSRGWTIKLGKLFKVHPNTARRWVVSNMPHDYRRRRSM